MATITVMDPVTRIEGHLKVELTIDQNQVTGARCTGALFRGFENILKGRDPLDAPVITERVCGVCPVSHGLSSVKALDAAAGITAPSNARLLRNLVLGSNYIQSHILHFYLLSAMDYVRGPLSAPWTPAWDVDIRPGAEAVANHLPDAIEARKRAHVMGAVFGGKMPLPHTYVPGGFTSVPTANRIADFRGHLTWLIDFIRYVYIPDVELLAGVYPDYHSVGRSYGNLLSYGVFDLADGGSSTLLKRGYVEGSAPGSVKPVAVSAITESVTRSWYAGTANLRPAQGQTKPVYPKARAYSWLKAPRYAGKPFEAGPLARMWVNGDYRNGVSVMDRHLARAYETLKVAQAMDGWLDQLSPGASVYKNYETPSTGSGVGLTEAPRGALGHWVRINGGKIANYQIITPTCWNASPRDGRNQAGPLEKALLGLSIEDPARPIEALRVVHSFDPCLSCAVHILRPDGKPVPIASPGRR